MAKRFYWLKLSGDFFESKEIKKLRKAPGGAVYVLIYLKMLLKSMADEGFFYFDGVEDTFAEEIALDIDEEPDYVKPALDLFLKLGLIESVDYAEARLTRLPEMVGSESDSARRMRKSRASKQLLTAGEASQSDNNVRIGCTEKRREEREIDKEIEGDTEKRIEEETPSPEAAASVPYSEIIDLYHGICTSYPRVRTISSERKKHIAARWSEYDQEIDTFRELFEKAEASSFLKGRNQRNWSADFNWLMNSDNMAKVLEDRYRDRVNGTRARREQSTLEMLEDMTKSSDSAQGATLAEKFFIDAECTPLED